MATFNNARDLARAQRLRFEKIRLQMISEHEQMIRDMESDAKELVSGKVSKSTLRRLGHPFGKTAGGRKRGKLPLLPINVQTGRLKRSLERRKISSHSSDRVYDIGFDAPYAKYVLAIGGTKRMVSRGYWREVKKRWKKRNFDLLMRIRALQRGS